MRQRTFSVYDAAAAVVAAGTMILGTATSSRAAFEAPNSARNAPDSWTRNSANTTYAQWAVFDSAYLGTNDLTDAGEGVYNPSGTPTLQQLNQPVPGGPPSIFLSGSGWIYGFNDPLSISVNVPNYNLGALYETDVVLQVRLLSGVDDMLLLDTVKLDGVAYDEIEEISRVEGTAMGSTSYTIEFWIKWNNVAGNAANHNLAFQTYTETGAGLGEHTFLQGLAVDTRASAIPEPASVGGVIGAGALALLARRGRRQR